MQNEHSVIRNFCRTITNEAELLSLGDKGDIYKELVFHRFDEVLSNTFPRFRGFIAPDTWEKMVTAFIQNGSSYPLIWQMPNAFRTFYKGRTGLAFGDDLLWYEWQEVPLFMARPKRQSLSFSWDGRWQLSPIAVTRHLRYRVFDPDFDESGKRPGDFGLLMYATLPDYAVHYQEITPFMAYFLSSLTRMLPDASLRQSCRRFGVDDDESAAMLTPFLATLVQNGLLKKGVA